MVLKPAMIPLAVLCDLAPAQADGFRFDLCPFASSEALVPPPPIRRDRPHYIFILE